MKARLPKAFDNVPNVQLWAWHLIEHTREALADVDRQLEGAAELVKQQPLPDADPSFAYLSLFLQAGAMIQHAALQLDRDVVPGIFALIDPFSDRVGGNDDEQD